MKKQLVILTGPSGTGISSARYVFEELGYFITENAPSRLTREILKDFAKSDFKTEYFCLMVGISVAKRVYEDAIKDENFDVKLFLLNASKDVILSRFALTRHTHPRSVSERISLENAIDLDLQDVLEVQPLATFSLDTSKLSIKELRKNVYDLLNDETVDDKTNVTFISFGFKNGTPLGLDMVLDVRNLPNPYWVDDLRELTGKDQKVIDYIMSFPKSQQLLDQFVSFLEYQLGEVHAAGRPSYTVGIACSGGQHRSYFVANYLASYFQGKYRTRVLYRDGPKSE